MVVEKKEGKRHGRLFWRKIQARKLNMKKGEEKKKA